MALPTKSRYTVSEAAQFISSASGEKVSAGQVLDWGAQGYYGLHVPADHCPISGVCTVQFIGRNDASEIAGSIVRADINPTQAHSFLPGYTVKIDSGWLDGREFRFMGKDFTGRWIEKPASFNINSLVILGAELQAFAASIAAPAENAPSALSGTPGSDEPTDDEPTAAEADPPGCDAPTAQSTAMVGIATAEIIERFRLGAPWAEKLRKASKDKYQYLLPARKQQGRPGGDSHRWNPAKLGKILVEKKERNHRAVSEVIYHHFPAWADDWDALPE